MIYELWRTNGEVEEIETDKPLSLEEQQKLVGGYITYVNAKIDKKDIIACINDEGLLQDLPRNELLPDYVGNVVVGRLKRNKFVGLEI